MKPVLTLETPSGAFVFNREEVPEHIASGGSQATSVDRLIGGRKIVRPLGPDESDISFSGLFAYQGTARSDFLDSVRRRGDACVLTWDNRRMLVIVSHYTPDYHKAYKIGYTITFLVVKNFAEFVDSVPAVTPTQQLKSDAQHLNNLAACTGISSISGYAASIFAGLKTVEAAAQPIANGLQSITSTIGQAANCAAAIGNQVTATVSAVAAPIAQLLANTQALISNTESAIINAVTFGGIAPGNPLATAVGGYMSQLNSAVQLPAIYEIQSVAQRMQKNLHLAANPTSAKTITVGGGNLFDVAAQQYGDGNRWNEIAAANGLTDPMITGTQTLVIP
jgi:hypothetical protein